jgi:hypothetical protein
MVQGGSLAVTINDDTDHSEPPTGGGGGGGGDGGGWGSVGDGLRTGGAARGGGAVGGGGAAGRHCDDGHMLQITSSMSDISWADISERENVSEVSDPEMGDAEPGEAPCALAGHTTLLVSGASRWSEELTLFQPWRCHTLKGLSKDCISHWKDSNEAEFRDGMYHSGFKWRVLMMSSLAFSVCLMVLVDPCLTVLGVLTFPFLLLLLFTQMAAQRMVDRRRGRQLGQRSLILICVGFACSAVPIAQYSSSGEAITWEGGTCTYENAATTHPFHVLNLFVGPATLFVGVMVTFMTISTRAYFVMVTGFLIPVTTAYFLRDNRVKSNLTYSSSQPLES